MAKQYLLFILLFTLILLEAELIFLFVIELQKIILLLIFVYAV